MLLTARPRFLRQAYSILQNQEDAEDAVQDAFLSAYRHRSKFEGRSAFTAWFTRIVFNAALMIRRKRRHCLFDSVPDSTIDNETSWIERIPACEPDPETVYRQEQTLQFFHALVQRMTPLLRQAFTMTYCNEMTCVEAAARLGVKTATFKARLFPARQHLINRAPRSLALSARGKPTHFPGSPGNGQFKTIPVRTTEILSRERASS
jgi:RNA polymerase sigma-70 factor, ECF subfamily